MNIALIGYGKMGKTIEPIAQSRNHNIVFCAGSAGFTEQDLTKADLCIEFSAPTCAFENITKCLAAGKPVVSGTTGWLHRWPELEAHVAATEGAFFYASNFSVGVNIFFALNRYLAKIMDAFPEYAAQIHEVHHTHKKDAPSGTAITLAQDAVAQLSRYTSYGLDQSAKDVLKITAERKDPTPGTHHIKYSSPIDDIELTHTAHSREGFAKGAVLAAEWLIGKKGIFSMADLMNL